jgi:hypothetical protein
VFLEPTDRNLAFSRITCWLPLFLGAFLKEIIGCFGASDSSSFQLKMIKEKD